MADHWSCKFDFPTTRDYLSRHRIDSVINALFSFALVKIRLRHFIWRRVFRLKAIFHSLSLCPAYFTKAFSISTSRLEAIFVKPLANWQHFFVFFLFLLRSFTIIFAESLGFAKRAAMFFESLICRVQFLK